jgi:hypothetical protein
MSVEENIVNVELGEIGNRCFVVMPFESLFDTEYERVIKPAVEEVGLECLRADEIFGKPRLVDDIWRSIRSARVIVAELTGRNPNVLYEVGLAHAVRKPVIIITRTKDDVPFDLGALRYLFYDTNDPQWGTNLKKGLVALLKAVLEEKGMSEYLEGIAPSEGLKLHRLEKVSTSEKTKEENLANISGLWRGGFGGENRPKHICAMNVDQQGHNLSVNMTITYEEEDEEGRAVTSVVQETFTGSISENNIKLTGVNYFFVQKGESKSYTLDNFNLVLSNNAMSMRGKIKEEGKAEGEAYFSKRKGRK